MASADSGGWYCCAEDAWLARCRETVWYALGERGRLGAEGLGERRRERTRELEVGGLAVLPRPLCGGETRAGPSKVFAWERRLTNGR